MDCAKDVAYYHKDGRIHYLSEDERYCPVRKQVFKLVDTKNLEYSFIAEKNQINRTYNIHCQKCHKTVPGRIEFFKSKKVEYDCCTANGDKSITILEIGHSCTLGEYIKDEKNYSLNSLCSTKSWEWFCNLPENCLGKRTLVPLMKRIIFLGINAEGKLFVRQLYFPRFGS